MSVLILSPNGKTTKKATLADAVAAADVVGKTIVVTTPITIDNVTIPATVAIEQRKGGIITVNSGKILTINGPDVTKGLFLRFDGSGSVKFGTGAVSEVYPEWWVLNTNPGTTDVSLALQAAINSVVGIPIILTAVEYFSSVSLSLPTGTNIKGKGQYLCRLVFDDTDGLVATETGYIVLRDLEVVMLVPHTTTPNTKAGIYLNGSITTRTQNNVLENVFINGFRDGVVADWIDASTFSRVHTYLVKNGLISSGLSINNNIHGCHFVGDVSTDGYGISFVGPTPSEGWMISDNLIYGFGIGVLGVGMSHVYLNNNIIDASVVNGVQLAPISGSPCENWRITNNFIAVTCANSGYGIVDISNVAGSAGNVGHLIMGNHVLTYGAGVMARGIDVSAGNHETHTIIGNTVNGTSEYDIAANSPSIVNDNVCKSTLAANIIGGSIVNNNTGTVYYARAAYKQRIGDMTITYDEAIPTTGTWKVGDVCHKVNPTAGGTPGWVCTASGSPGTWKAMANLAA